MTVSLRPGELNVAHDLPHDARCLSTQFYRHHGSSVPWLRNTGVDGIDALFTASASDVSGWAIVSKHNQAVLLIQAHPVDNQSTTWKCQDWVRESLENLEQHGLLQASWNTTVPLVN